MHVKVDVFNVYLSKMANENFEITNEFAGGYYYWEKVNPPVMKNLKVAFTLNSFIVQFVNWWWYGIDV